MKLVQIQNAITSAAGRQILLGQKHSPTILFVGGITGVVASTVMACKATLKLESIVQEAEMNHELANTLEHKSYSERDRQQDHVKIKVNTALDIVKLYAPAAIVGTISIAALTGSHVVLSKRNAAVMAAYSALDRGFNDYRQRVRDEFGEDKELEFRHGSEIKAALVTNEDGEVTTVDDKVVPNHIPSVYARFFDELSSSWSREPEYNRAFLNCQQNYANDLLRSRGHVFLNEVYDMLGISRTKAGAVVGWVLSKDSDNFIDFGVYDESRERARAFVQGHEKSILLDFNVDGVIYDLI